MYPCAPFVAVPTTAGSGTEVTRNAVIISRKHNLKVSMRSARLLPRLVLVDPELTYSLPPRSPHTPGSMHSRSFSRPSCPYGPTR
ncbi:MAG TPA: iron-containing alcohol dehydrogenase [Deltaproteobacteria bacterium]|nr:iron-containing alcohol dehydrogenase [Deltaproteobacteria bacterium]